MKPKPVSGKRTKKIDTNSFETNVPIAQKKKKGRIY